MAKVVLTHKNGFLALDLSIDEKFERLYVYLKFNNSLMMMMMLFCNKNKMYLRIIVMNNFLRSRM